MIPPDSPIKRAILTTGLPAEPTRGIPGERPICHYTGKRCMYESAGCTCLLPGFQGTPPTWASDRLRVELDKCDGLDEADKTYLLAIACAGIEYAEKLRGSAGNAGVRPVEGSSLKDDAERVAYMLRDEGDAQAADVIDRLIEAAYGVPSTSIASAKPVTTNPEGDSP